MSARPKREVSFHHAAGHALWAGQRLHIDLNAQRFGRYAQAFRFGAEELYRMPGPQFKGLSDAGRAHHAYYIWVDRYNTLGLGANVPVASTSADNSSGSGAVGGGAVRWAVGASRWIQAPFFLPALPLMNLAGASSAAPTLDIIVDDMRTSYRVPI